MKTKPLVSLIIPVYNVESYLRDCLNSVCGQTYQTIEIIVVNDGSTDGSQAICEEYAGMDRRIRLITKENGGLSSARNAGLLEATGEYIGFVDSDDQIHSMFVEALMRALLLSDCGIAVCDYSMDREKIACTDWGYELLSNTDAVSGLLDDGGYKCFACNKIFRKVCFKDIWFPEGKLFEDIKLIYEIMKMAGPVAYVRQPLYFYRMRKESITKAKFSQGTYHLLESIDYLLEDARKRQDLDHNRLLTGYMSYYMGFVRRGLMSRADIGKEAERLRQLIKSKRTLILRRHSNIRIIKKVELLIFAYMPQLYRLVLYLA